MKEMPSVIDIENIYHLIYIKHLRLELRGRSSWASVKP